MTDKEPYRINPKLRSPMIERLIAKTAALRQEYGDPDVEFCESAEIYKVERDRPYQKPNY